MMVYHVSSASIKGGAARAALRLHRGLTGSDEVESLWLDAGGLPDAPGVQHLNGAAEAAPLLTRMRRSQWRKKVQNSFRGVRTPFSSPMGWGHPSSFKKLPRPDVWNLHWVSHFLDWEHLLPWMAEQAPVVWTLHDLNPLMGVWHYVPGSGELNGEREKTEREAVALKRRALARIPKGRLTFVGPSKWMVEQCRHSPVTQGFPVVHIPYGLDTDVFAPRDRRIVRAMFGIPDEALVLGFVADQIGDPRKGMAQLQAAVTALPTSIPVHVLTVGNGHSPKFQFPHHHLGGIQSDHLLSFFYSACDLFVCPSLQDNLPNTVLESLACGTPVVAYETGGLPDMVRAGVSGKVVNQVGDSASFGSAITECLTNSQALIKLRTQARELAVKEYTLGVQASHYAQLYGGLYEKLTT
jgi:glycosyltransferase involved in cell wall biosynthesis